VFKTKSHSRPSVRAGGYALGLLAVPLNDVILQALAEGPKALADLRRSIGLPPQTTVRARLRNLTEFGVVEKHRHGNCPSRSRYGLTRSGEEILAVSEVLRRWLAASPEGPIALGSVTAKSALNALLEAWRTGILRALAARPLSLAELDSIVTTISYSSLERRLSELRLTGQVSRISNGATGGRYGVAPWLRQAVAPLGAAASWERSHLSGKAPPISNRDVETAFMLSVPLLHLPPAMSGSCRLAVGFPSEEGLRLAGVLVTVEGGRIVSCVSRLEGAASAWASGSVGDWFTAVLKDDPASLETGGDPQSLPFALVEGLHRSLVEGGSTVGSLEPRPR
jgi:DNA-binding HxlR family transcriptional regulator